MVNAKTLVTTGFDERERVMATQAESVVESPGGPPPAGGDEAGNGDKGWSRGRVAILVLAIAALVAVFFLTRAPEPEEAAAPAQTTPRNYEIYIDPETGFSLEHPDTWIPIRRPEGNQRLVLSAGGQSTVSVRFNENEQPVNNVADLEKVREVTDRIAGPSGVQVLKREALTVNGMPTIYYLSRFTDEASGQKGVNAQHFIFQGTNMYILLFQGFPEEDFDRLAPEFDRIRASFHGDPDYVAPETPAEPPPPPPG